MLSSFNMSEADRQNVMNPQAGLYAQQAAASAQSNPGNSEAQRTARYWADVAQFQMRMQQGQGPAPTAPGAPSAPQMQGGQYASPHLQTQAPATSAPTLPQAVPPLWTQGQLDPRTGPSIYQ